MTYTSGGTGGLTLRRILNAQRVSLRRVPVAEFRAGMSGMSGLSLSSSFKLSAEFGAICSPTAAGATGILPIPPPSNGYAPIDNLRLMGMGDQKVSIIIQRQESNIVAWHFLLLHRLTYFRHWRVLRTLQRRHEEPFIPIPYNLLYIHKETSQGSAANKSSRILYLLIPETRCRRM